MIFRSSFLYSPARGTIVSRSSRFARLFFPGLLPSLGLLAAMGSAFSTAAQAAGGPTITTQPVSQTVPAGSTATFSVKAAGVPTLTYQWLYLSGKVWKPFAAGTGYNTATMTTAATTAVFNGLNFRVLVTDGNGLSTSSNTVTLTVTEKAVPIITWATPAAILYGTALSAKQLDATASVAGTFVYSPAAGAVLTAGSQTLSATFTPTNAAGYSTETAMVMLTVAKATPNIAWAPTGAIAVGMVLGPEQLDATASAPGSSTALPGAFVYSPAAGATLNSSGPQALFATFTPTDQVDYASVEASTTLTVLPFGVVAWGDSLSVGGQGHLDQGTYPGELAQLLTLPVVNQGVNANTTGEIGVRQGGIPAYATVAGGVIPAAGSVTVTFPVLREPVTDRGPAGGVGGDFLGVQGLVTYNAGVYTFTRTTPGSPVSAPGTPQFVVDNPYAAWIPIFWEGRNDSNDNSEIVADIAAQVAFVPPGQNYLILSEINGNAPDEWAGGSSYSRIVSLNNQLADIYGTHYLDIRELLVSSYDPTQATDVADFNHDIVPTSLRALSGTATLVDAIGPADTALTFKTASGSMGPGNVLTIDTGENAENAAITGFSPGDIIHVERDLGGNNTSHAAGAKLSISDYFHLNAEGYQIVANAVAQFLSAYASKAKK
jgi:hypothetical protein